MKKLFILILFAGLSLPALAQKNVFYVPVPETVEQSKLYVQPGADITNNKVQLSNILTYGLGNNFQIGLNVTDVTINYDETGGDVFPYSTVDPGVNPDILLHLQKGFELSDKVKVGLGTWSGANIANEIDFSSFNYANFSAELLGQNKVIVGGYYGNNTFVASGNNTALMAGLEVPVISEKLKLIGDYVSGKNERSKINLGIELKLFNKWEFSLGAQLPSPGSENNHEVTFQINN